MFKSIIRKLAKWRRQRHLARIRREFFRCGYPTAHLDDTTIEGALTGDTARSIEDVRLTPKTIYFALRRL